MARPAALYFLLSPDPSTKPFAAQAYPAAMASRANALGARGESRTLSHNAFAQKAAITRTAQSSRHVLPYRPQAKNAYMPGRRGGQILARRVSEDVNIVACSQIKPARRGGQILANRVSEDVR